MAHNPQQTKGSKKNMDFFDFDIHDGPEVLLRADSVNADSNLWFKSTDSNQKLDLFDWSMNNTQISFTKNALSQQQDSYHTHQCQCICRRDTFVLPEPQVVMPTLSLLRQESGPSQGGFRLHKTASQQDFLNLAKPYGMYQDRMFNGLDQSEVLSRSTEAESSPQVHLSKPTIVDLAIDMIENHKLVVSAYGELDNIDKLYLANIVCIKNRLKIGLELSTAEFVETINSNLGGLKEKRNDDRLRFIYKRAIKYLLGQRSEYTANKLHRMDDFKEPLVSYYFPKNPEVMKDLMDTSFASKKKILKLFGLSTSFKQDFLQFAREEIRPIYLNYTKETYKSMLKLLNLRTSKKDGNSSAEVLLKTFKRLPWRINDIETTIDQITTLKGI